jgi:hypothetical protein
MRLLRTVVLGALLLLVPRVVDADVIAFPIGEGGAAQGIDFTFGLEPVHAVFFFDDFFFGDAFGSGTAEFESGPLIELEITGPDTHVYTYGPGTLTITAALLDLSDGSEVTGTFTAALGEFTIDVRDCTIPACADAFAELGPGLFDPTFAALLGIPGPSTGGTFFHLLDDITGTPASDVRLAGSQGGKGTLTVYVTVPEPSLSVLGMMLTGAWMLRHRQRRLSHPRVGDGDENV